MLAHLDGVNVGRVSSREPTLEDAYVGAGVRSAVDARTLRLLAISYWLHLKMIAVSAFDGVFQVVWPLYFATVAFLLYGRADDRGCWCTPASGRR